MKKYSRFKKQDHSNKKKIAISCIIITSITLTAFGVSKVNFKKAPDPEKMEAKTSIEYMATEDFRKLPEKKLDRIIEERAKHMAKITKNGEQQRRTGSWRLGNSNPVERTKNRQENMDSETRAKMIEFRKRIHERLEKKRQN